MKKLIYLLLLMVAMLTINNVVFAQIDATLEGLPDNYIVKVRSGGLSESIIYEELGSFNIGIGTTVPVQKLDVLGNISLDDQLYFKNFGSIYFGTSNPPGGRLDFHGKEDYSGPYVTVMSLLNDGGKGSVGIGTPDPDYTLHVKGEMLVETPDPYGAPVIYASPLGLVGIGTTNPTSILDVEGDISLSTSLFFKGDGGIVSWEDGSKLSFRTSSLHIMEISGNGKIGIGCISPQEKLHVIGNILTDGFIMPTNAADGRLLVCDALGNSSWIDQNLIDDGDWYKDGENIYRLNGNVGIGCISPQEKLHVIGNILTDGFIMPTNAADGRLLVCDAIGNSSWIDQDLIDDGDWYKDGENIYRLNGNVGIGTDNPYEKFQIGELFTFHSGGTKFIGYNVYYDGGDKRIINDEVSCIRFGSNGDINFWTALSGDPDSIIEYNKPMIITNDGNVGIGIESPNEQLHVNGKVVIGGQNLIRPEGYKLYVEEGILAEKVKVELVSNWSDFVFEKIISCDQSMI